MDKRKLASSLLIVFAAGLVFLFYFVHQKQTGLHKLLMPGTYQLKLEPETFSIWSFWEWPTKGISGVSDNPGISIVDQRGEPIPRNFVACPGPPLRTIQNVGRMRCSIVLKQPSLVTISSEEKCVVVVQPSSALIHEPITGLISFFGCFDDFNFEKSKSSN